MDAAVGFTFSSSRSSLKKNAALCAWNSGPLSSSCESVERMEGVVGPDVATTVVGRSQGVGAGGEGADVKMSPGRTPSASAAASAPGRFPAREEMIFLRN